MPNHGNWYVMRIPWSSNEYTDLALHLQELHKSEDIYYWNLAVNQNYIYATIYAKTGTRVGDAKSMMGITDTELLWSSNYTYVWQLREDLRHQVGHTYCSSTSRIPGENTIPLYDLEGPDKKLYAHSMLAKKSSILIPTLPSNNSELKSIQRTAWKSYSNEQYRLAYYHPQQAQQKYIDHLYNSNYPTGWLKDGKDLKPGKLL